VTTDDALLAAAEGFADDLAALLNATVTTQAPVRALAVGPRLVVAPFAEDDVVPIPMTVRGVAGQVRLHVSYRLGWDSARRFLAVEYSQFALALAFVREPFIRFEYVRGAHAIPDAHVQVHADSGALGYMLALAGRADAPKVQTVHIPVGGKRFRPCLEDVIELAVHELGVDGHPGWEAYLDASRREWRRFQLAAAVRDDPDTAARVLAELGREEQSP
jgi:hypothetical protein